MISINLIPNYSKEEIKIALAALLSPWTFWQDKYQKLLTEKLRQYLGVKHCFLFDSGRTSFYFLLRAFGIGAGDEVIIQSFTCSVVPAAIVNCGAYPVYVDIGENYNIDPKKITEKINFRTRAVVVQHTFGKPAKIDLIAKICRQRGVVLIEDCAHGLGGEVKDKKIGSFGDAAFLSFGRDKVISGIWGGALVFNKNEILSRLEDFLKNCPRRSFFWSIKQLLYIPIIALVIKTYDFFDLGKALHWLFKKAKWLDDAVSIAEKRGVKRRVFYQGLPEFQARLVYCQLLKIGKTISHRKKLAKFYAAGLEVPFDKTSTYLRFTFESKKAGEIREKARRENIFLGDWYDQAVAPRGIDLQKLSYFSGACPIAERKSLQVINLPTNPNLDLKDAGRVLDIVKSSL